MNHIVSLFIAFLISLLLIAPAWGQNDCANDLDCFMAAVQQNNAVTVTFSDDQFFAPLDGDLQQSWAYLPNQRSFTISYQDNEASEALINHGVNKDRRRASARDMKVKFDILREELGEVPAVISCPCESTNELADYLRAWSLGSYSIYDLERLKCTWAPAKSQSSPKPTTAAIAPGIEVELITLNVKREAHLAPLGKGYYPEGTSVVLELDFGGENPIGVNRNLSTLAYFLAGEQSLLSEGVTEVNSSTIDYLELFQASDEEVEKHRQNRYFQMIKNDSIHQVRIRTSALPGAEANHISLAGKLAFDFAAEESKTLRRTIETSTLPYQQWFAPGFYLDMRRDENSGKLQFHLANRKWTTFDRLLISDGEQEWEFSAENIHGYHFLDSTASELEVEIYYQEREVRYVPFEFAVGMDL